MKQTLFFIAVIAYAVAFVWLLLRIKNRKENGMLAARPVFWGLSLIAVASHAILLLNGLVIENGLNLGVFKALSLVSAIIVVLLMLTSIRKPVECLAILLYPATIVTIALDQYLVSDLIVKFGQSWQLQAHIFISIVAYSFLTIAVVQSIVLAIQDHHLHTHQPGGLIQSLPPLRVMEQLLFQIITIGFVLLTLGLVIGILFIEDIFAQRLIHKTVLSLLAWGIFATLLWGRWQFGWRGRKAIRWALGGFLLLMLAFVGTKIVLELIIRV